MVGNDEYSKYFNSCVKGNKKLFVNHWDLVPNSLSLAKLTSDVFDSTSYVQNFVDTDKPYVHTNDLIRLDQYTYLIDTIQGFATTNIYSLHQDLPNNLVSAHSSQKYIQNLEIYYNDPVNTMTHAIGTLFKWFG